MVGNLIYKMQPDRLSRRITWTIIAAVATVAVVFAYLSMGKGAYMPAWFLATALSIAALYILSIPRTVRITENGVEIHCIVELTTIAARDIASVRLITERPMGLILLLGSYGFFGYYGYYLDIARWEIVKVYARSRTGLVEITDIYEQRYLVSATDPEGLVDAVRTAQQSGRETL